MAIDTKIQIIDREGYAADEGLKEILHASYTNVTIYRAYAIPLTKTEVDFGAVTTARYVCILPVGSIRVYQSRSPESWLAEGCFLAEGCEITALSLQAVGTATTAWIMVAGD